MQKRLDGKIAAITGGNTGIGLATARKFAAQGAKVAILARSKEKADKAIAEIGHEAVGSIGDVTEPDSLDQLMARTSYKQL